MGVGVGLIYKGVDKRLGEMLRKAYGWSYYRLNRREEGLVEIFLGALIYTIILNSVLALLVVPIEELAITVIVGIAERDIKIGAKIWRHRSAISLAVTILAIIMAYLLYFFSLRVYTT